MQPGLSLAASQRRPAWARRRGRRGIGLRPVGSDAGAAGGARNGEAIWGHAFRHRPHRQTVDSRRTGNAGLGAGNVAVRRSAPRQLQALRHGDRSGLDALATAGPRPLRRARARLVRSGPMPLRLGLASLPARRDYGQVLDAVRTTLMALAPPPPRGCSAEPRSASTGSERRARHSRIRVLYLRAAGSARIQGGAYEAQGCRHHQWRQA